MWSASHSADPLSLVVLLLPLLVSLLVHAQGISGQSSVNLMTCSNSSHQSPLPGHGFVGGINSGLVTSGALTVTTNTTVYGLVLHYNWASNALPCATAHVRLGLYITNTSFITILTLLDQTADYVVAYTAGGGYLYFPTLNAVKSVMVTGSSYEVALASDSADLYAYSNTTSDTSSYHMTYNYINA